MTVAVDDYDPCRTCLHRFDTTPLCETLLWLSGLVVSALGIRARGPRFEPGSHHYSIGYQSWASCTHTASPAPKKTGVQKEFSALSGCGDYVR